MSAPNQTLDYFSQALDRLGEALNEPKDNPLYTDGVIQRFEFYYELGWKAIKSHLLQEGIIVASPREAFNKAFAMGWVQEEEPWLAMLRARNITSHTYRKAEAELILAQIPVFYEAFPNPLKLVSASPCGR